MIPLWWSVLLAVVGVGGLYALTKKKWWGFALGLVAQLLWVSYALATVQYGFIASALAYGAVNAVGLHSWLKDRKDADERSMR